MLDVLIIGSGPVGLYASTLASLHGLNGLLIEGLDTLGGQLTSLYPEKEIVDLPGFKSITAKEFIENLTLQMLNRSNSLPYHLEETMENFQKEDNYFIVKTNKSTYQTKTILLVTGMGVFSPRKLDLENIDSFDNIIYSIKNKNELKNKEVVILGGGDSAVDWANTLSSICKKVSIVHRRDEFRAKEENVKMMTINNVNIYKPYQIKSISGDNHVASKISLKNDSQEIFLSFDVLFVNYGLISTPTRLHLETINNSFKVNTLMMTSEENIFAIGNACSYLGKVKNITSGLGEAVTAITKIDQIIHPNKNIPLHF